jgi:peptidoglycan/xylan/chitin deacetylase (PgdA/CDA1 family)
MAFGKRLIVFLRDFISFIIYLFICLNFFRKRQRDKCVVLLYHSVGHKYPGEDPYRLNITPENFNAHLKVIAGYSDRKIELTFDDGYGNNFTNAFSLLKGYGLSATIFLVTDFIDKKISSESFAGKDFNKRPLTWEEIKIMDMAGIKFGSHSKTHLFLSKAPKDELEKELTGSKRRIEEVLGYEIDKFSYPFGSIGSFNDATKEALINATYNYAYTNVMGQNPVNPVDKLVLKRLRIYTEDGPFRLKMKIEGAYDWVDAILSLKRRKI